NYPHQGWEYYAGDLDKNDDDDLGERMGFFFRSSLVDFLETGTWQEDNDKFHRAPVYAHVNCSTCRKFLRELKDFYIFNFHAWPETALDEIKAMPAFYHTVSAHFGVEDMLFAGSIDAADYITPDDIKDSLPSSEPGFHWLIGNKVDSVTNSSESASLQRLLACTDAVLQGFKGKHGHSVKVKQKYNLTREEAYQISALKPIEMKLKHH
ncbi:hypothetical protein RRG08_017685, partial [Elysia crispata]